MKPSNAGISFIKISYEPVGNDMKIKKRNLMFIILLFTILGFSLGIFSTHKYQVSVVPTQTESVKNPKPDKTTTPIPSATLEQSITPDQTDIIEAIIVPTRDVFHCLSDFVDWSMYKNKSLKDIAYDIGHTLSWEEKDGYFKTNAQFVGKFVFDGEPIFDRLGFPVYLFEQNDKTYQVSVNPRIENELEKLLTGTTITLFIEVNTFDLQYISQTLLHDYKLPENETNTPDFHWSVAIKQNGNLLDEPEITIKNQPFTIFVYLPRITKDVPIVLLNINEKSKWEDNVLLNHNINDNCEGHYIPPNYPFCPGCGPTSNGDRAIRLSDWHFIILSFYNCDFNNMSEITFDEANIILEKDVFNFEVPEDDGYFLGKTNILPISEFSNDSYELTFFLDINENEIFDAGEIKKIKMYIRE
jgi:hypothetical protein